MSPKSTNDKPERRWPSRRTIERAWTAASHPVAHLELTDPQAIASKIVETAVEIIVATEATQELK